MDAGCTERLERKLRFMPPSESSYDLGLTSHEPRVLRASKNRALSDVRNPNRSRGVLRLEWHVTRTGSRATERAVSDGRARGRRP